MSCKCGIVTVFAVVSFSWAASDIQAAEAVDNFELSPEQLFDATVISASKTSEKLMDAPAAVYVLSNEDIMRSGATSIPEALRLVPGVQVARVNANSWAIGIRGFNGTLDNKLLVLIDGRTVYDPLFSGVYWDIQDTMLEDIDRIEVIRGPGAALWGANAVNGVINIITKKAADTQGNLASATVGTQDGIAEERYGGKLGDNGYYRAYAKYLTRDDEQTLSGTDAHDAQEENRGGFRADWNGTGDAKDDFTLQGDAYSSGASQFRITSAFAAPYSPLALEDLDAHGGNVLGRWNRTLSDDSKFTLQSYADYTYRDQLLLKDQRETFDVDAQYELPSLGSHKIILGGGYRYSNDTLTGTPLLTFTNIGEQTQLFSSFIQDKITLEPKTWFLTLGSKFEHNDYTGFEVEPDARLQWSPDEKDMVWTSVSRAVRTPSRLEEDLHIIQGTGPFGMTGILASIDTIPNPALESEQVIAYELGYRRQWTPKVSSDIATFYNAYHGLSTYNLAAKSIFIEGFDPTRAEEPLIPQGTAWAETYGVETSVNWRALDTLNVSASHSLLEMAVHDLTSGAASEQEIEKQSPKYQANLRVSWDITPKVSYDTTLYYVSALSDYLVESHTRLDMRLGWRIIDGLEFDLVGQDLLDPHTHEFLLPATTPSVVPSEINRSVYGKLTWRF